MEYVCKINSPIGILTISSDKENLTGLWIEGQKFFCSTININTAKLVDSNYLLIFREAENWLKKYFNGEKVVNNLSINPKGSEFQKTVWSIINEIPYGETLTYGDIAMKISKLRGEKFLSARAVGNAVGKNPISIIVPCHRVIGANKNLTGYAGGIDKKKKLLELEKTI